MEDQDSHPAGDMDKTNISEETSGDFCVSSNQPEATTVSLYQGNYLHLSSSIYHIYTDLLVGLSIWHGPTISPCPNIPNIPNIPILSHVWWTNDIPTPTLINRGSPTYNLKLLWALNPHREDVVSTPRLGCMTPITYQETWRNYPKMVA